MSRIIKDKTHWYLEINVLSFIDNAFDNTRVSVFSLSLFVGERQLYYASQFFTLLIVANKRLEV